MSSKKFLGHDLSQEITQDSNYPIQTVPMRHSEVISPQLSTSNSIDSSPNTSGFFHAPHFQLSQQNLRDLERSVSPFEIPALTELRQQSSPLAANKTDANIDNNVSTGIADNTPYSRKRPNMDFPNFVEVIQQQIDLRIASSNNPTAVLELDMDGNVRHLSKNWELIVGTNINKIVNRSISKIIVGNDAEDVLIFHKAIKQMIHDDDSYKVKFITPTNDTSAAREFNSSEKSTPNNSLEDLTIDPQTFQHVAEIRKDDDEQSGKNQTKVEADTGKESDIETGNYKDTDSELSTNGEIIELEAQGILIHDSKTKLPTHSMWTIRPFVVVNLDLELPTNLVNLLGFGSEFFEGYLTNLKELGIINEEAVPQPKTILCRICEQHIPVWFIERHSELCIVEHRGTEELQSCHDSISEQKDLIVQILESLTTQQRQIQLQQQQQQQQQHSPKQTPSSPSISSSPLQISPLSGSPNSSTSSLINSTLPVLEYKGLPLPLPSTVSLETSPRLMSQPMSKNQPIARSMLKKFPFGILQRLLELCDEALQINIGDEINVADVFQFSPNTERAINSVINWKVFETNDLAIRAMVEDTQRLCNEKIELLSREISILQYSKKIKNQVDELVLQTVRETVQKIKEKTYMYESEGVEQQDLDIDTDRDDEIALKKAISDTHLNETIAVDSPKTSIKQLNHITDRILDDPFETASNSSSSSTSLSKKFNRSVTPKDILLRGRLMDVPRSSTPTLPMRNSKTDLLVDTFNDLELNTLQSPIRSILGVAASGTATSSSSSGGRGRDSFSSGNQYTARRHLSPAPYVERQSLSSFQRNSNARYDTNSSTPISSPHIQTTDMGIDFIPSFSEKRTSSGSSINNSSLGMFLGISLMQGGAQGSSFSGPSGGNISNKSSVSKPPLSPLLVSQTSSIKPQGSIKDYEILKAISKGAFGSVFLARKKLTGDYVAIKCLKKTDMIAKNQILNVKSERAVMMRQSDSPYVAQLYNSFQTKEYLYLVMEYLNGGDCATLLKALGTLGNEWARTYIAEVIVGVDDLHGRGIIHRDLKPDNLLIDSKGHIKLTDFGLSRMGILRRQNRPHRKSSASDQSIDYFRKSITQGLTGLGLPGNITDSPKEFHKRTSSVTPFSLSPTLEYAKLSAPFSLSSSEPASAISTGPPSGSLNHRPSLTSFRQKREGSNSSTIDSPLLRATIPRNSSETSFALIDDDFHESQAMERAANSITSYALYDPQNDNSDIKKFVGTPDYLSPETITGEGQNEASDWWSIGCILFEFVFGYPPFHGDKPEEVFNNILTGRIDWPPLSHDEEIEICPPECKDLLNRLLALSPDHRLGNNGADEIKSHPYFAGINWDELFTVTPSFVPTLDDPESTDYFDSRGADISQFPKGEQDEDDDPDRLGLSKNSQYSTSIHSSELGSPSTEQSLTLHPTNSNKKERRGSRLADNTEFGSFNFRNLAVLEKANKDAINRLKNEHLEHRNSFSGSTSSSDSISSNSRSRGFSLTGSSSPFKRPISPQHRGQSPSKDGSVSGETPASGALVFASGSGSPQIFGSVGMKHDRIGSAMSTYSSGDEYFEISKVSPGNESVPIFSSSSASSSVKGRSNSENQLLLGPAHRSSVSSLSKQIFKSVTTDYSPSSSDNEDTKSSALLRVRKRRQSSRRPGSFSIQQGELGQLEKPTLFEVDVLFCEPIPIVRHSITKILERLGCIVVAVSDGDELIRRAMGKVKFDVIFTALKISKVDAPDAVKLMRYTTGVNSATPIVAITGFAKEAKEANCFDEILEKPIDSNVLRTCIARFCNWSQAIVDGANDEAIESENEA